MPKEGRLDVNSTVGLECLWNILLVSEEMLKTARTSAKINQVELDKGIDAEIEEPDSEQASGRIAIGVMNHGAQKECTIMMLSKNLQTAPEFYV